MIAKFKFVHHHGELMGRELIEDKEREKQMRERNKLMKRKKDKRVLISV